MLSSEDLYISFFESDKEFESFIRGCKKAIRGSLEYKRWSKYLKEVLGLNTCAVSGEISENVTIEIHHHPLTMEEIVTILTDTLLSKNKKITTFQIVEEVLKIHYDDNVGYVPLATTYHEKYHSGALNLDINLVRGNYQYLIENDFIVRPEIKVKYLRLINITQSKLLEVG